MDVQTMFYNVLKDAITLIGTVGLGFLTAYIKSHYSAKQIDSATSIVKLSVGFAEQVAQANGFDSKGKFNAALTQAKNLAGKYGLKYSDEQWTAMIESCVLEAKKDWVDINTPIQPEQPQNDVKPVNNIVVPVVDNTVENKVLAVPQDMLNPLYDVILQKTNKDLISTVNGVINTVTNAIVTPEITPTPEPVQPVTPAQ